MSVAMRSFTEPLLPAILIVDDDEDIALVLRDLLEHTGYRVQIAGTGADAVAKTKVDSFAAVLLDLMLPDMDGLSLLALLKQIDPVVPVIMLTAFVEVAKKHGSLTEGAFGYLTKPYDTEELKAVIARAVKVKHLSLEAASAKQALTASEDRFREVVQTAPDAIILADGGGHILSWNSAAERLFGYSASEVLGQSMTLIMPERYRATHRCALERVCMTGDLRLKGAIVPLHGLHKDGGEIPIEMSVSSWVSGGQRVHCGIARDITARKVAEARLVQQQIEQQVLLDLIPAMVWYKDAHNRIIRANRRAAESIHKTVTEVEGHYTDEFYPEEAERYHLDDLEVIVSGRSKLGIVEPYRSGEGEKRWVQTDKVPYLDPEGNILGVLVFSQDITERRQIEAALRVSEERIRIVVQSAQSGVLMVDADGKIVLANARFEKQFGYVAEDLLGRSADLLFRPGLASHFRQPQSDLVSYSKQGIPQEQRLDIVGVRKDGIEFPLSIRLTSSMTANGICVVVTVDDRQDQA